MTLSPNELRWKQMVWLNKEQLLLLSWALEEEVYTQTHVPNRRQSALYLQPGTQGALPQYRGRDLAPGLGQVQESQFTSAGLHDFTASSRAAAAAELWTVGSTLPAEKTNKKKGKVTYVNTCNSVSTFAPPTPNRGSASPEGASRLPRAQTGHLFTQTYPFWSSAISAWNVDEAKQTTTVTESWCYLLAIIGKEKKNVKARVRRLQFWPQISCLHKACGQLLTINKYIKLAPSLPLTYNILFIMLQVWIQFLIYFGSILNWA